MKCSKNLCILVLVIGLLGLFAGCKTVGTNKENTNNADSTKPVIKKVDVVVYYPKMTDTENYLVREVHKLNKTADLPKAAVEELINGTPKTKGAYKVLPAATKVRSITVDKQGVATVDFSKEVLQANVGASGESLGIASIVNTLTEFSNIKKVSFTVDGKAENAMDWWGHVGLYEQPFNRNLSSVYEPAIWVDSPVAEETVQNPFQLSGSARVFEATVSYRIKDSNGNILAEGFTNASEGAPGRGDFQTQVGFTSAGPGQGQLEVFETSMKDGSDLNKVIIPVKWN